MQLSKESSMAANTDDVGMMSDEAIESALAMTRARLARAERERGDLERVIAATREEERLLSRLLALRRTGTTNTDGVSAEEGLAVGTSYATAGDSGHPALRAVISELETSGRPLHISELMRLLRERKVSVPGSGTQANLITHLRRDDRLIRPSRGMYGLAIWGLQAMPATRRIRRKKRRIHITASEGRTQR
jgi:hypothetical protein